MLTLNEYLAPCSVSPQRDDIHATVSCARTDLDMEARSLQLLRHPQLEIAPVHAVNAIEGVSSGLIVPADALVEQLLEILVAELNGNHDLSAERAFFIQ